MYNPYQNLGQAPGKGQKIYATYTTVDEGLTEQSWPFECLTSPEGVRPPEGRTVNVQSELVITGAGATPNDKWLTVVSFTPASVDEGYAIKFAGSEVGAIGTDLQWRITVDGSMPSTHTIMLGGWSTMDSPVEIVVPFVFSKTTALEVFAPAAGGAPRTVRGLIRGWVANFPPSGPVISKLRGSITS